MSKRSIKEKEYFVHKIVQNLTNLENYDYDLEDSASAIMASYCMSKKTGPNLYSNVLYKLGQDFLDNL